MIVGGSGSEKVAVTEVLTGSLSELYAVSKQVTTPAVAEFSVVVLGLFCNAALLSTSVETPEQLTVRRTALAVVQISLVPVLPIVGFVFEKLAVIVARPAATP